MAEPEESRVLLTLALEPEHWRRHDRGYWAQILAGAVDDAAPELMRVTTYELQDTLILVHARAKRPAKVMKKLLRKDDAFMRLRSRLVDLGARPDIEIVEE